MADHLYCLSDPAEPGLVRVALHSDREAGGVCRPGERIDWSLKLRNAPRAMATLHRIMCRYRKSRGNSVYRCSPRDVREIMVRYSVFRQTGWEWVSARVEAALTVATMTAKRRDTIR